MTEDPQKTYAPIDIVVMLVDDQAIVGKLVQQMLSGHSDINFHYCHDPAQAIKEMESFKPTVILLDLFMPVINGLELLKRLRQNKLCHDIPVIMLSTEEEAESKRQAFENGANDYVIKLPDKVELIARLRHHSLAYISKIQRDKAFEALRNAQASLEEQNIELHAAYRKLKEQNQELIETAKIREVVEHISRHDLKTPLNSILGFSQLLLADENLDDETMDCLKYIETAGYQILNMINRTLDLYKMEQGTYQLKPVSIDLGKIIFQMLAELQPLMEQSQVEIVVFFDERPLQKNDYFAVCGEVSLCRSILENLLKNALEASPAGEKIEIFLQYLNQESVIRIRNHGEVPEAIRENFFDKYVTANKNNGTGLGTYSAALNTRAQKGHIELDCSEKGMTSVLVHLPSTGEHAQR